MLNLSRFVPWRTSPKIVVRPEKFKSAFQAATRPVADKDKSRLWITPEGGRVRILLDEKSPHIPARRDHLLIARFVSETPGQGHGNAVMNGLLSLADEFGISLGMHAEPIAHKAMNHDALIHWLENHDFEEYAHPPGLYFRDPRPPQA